MRLSAQAIREFKAIWKDEYHEELSDAAAEEHALRLLRLYAMLSRPVPPHQGLSLPEVNGKHFDKSQETRTIEEESV